MGKWVIQTILQSKLSEAAYSVADPAQYLTGDVDGLDPVFAGRLAYAAKVSKTKFKITDGYRPYEEQVKMYNDYKAGKLQATAAIPGTSWHGSRLAVDTSSPPIRQMKSAELKKYGLCKPLSREGWHIQPVETASMGVRCNLSLSPVNLSEQIKEKFGLAGATIDYLEKYKYAVPLFEGLLTGKKDFSAETMKYLYSYKHWESLRDKLGL